MGKKKPAKPGIPAVDFQVPIDNPIADPVQDPPPTVPDPAETIADGTVEALSLPTHAARSGRRIDIKRLSFAASVGLGRIREGLRRTDRRKLDGRLPNPNSSADFVRLLLEMASDPDVTEIVFRKGGK